MARIAFLLVGLFVVACGSDAVQTADTVADIKSEVLAPDEYSFTDIAGIDSASADSVKPDIKTQPDAQPDLVGPACEPGEGCFLDACQEGSDCLSGWCVEHMGEGVCTEPCSEDCPDGWTCRAVAGTDPDLVYVCVSNHANLCKPCASSADCISPAGADDSCVSYGAEGSFCGGICDSANPCPWGFSCLETDTSDGLPITSCVADAGVCPCTDKSVELALWTPCSLENGFGTCLGKRVCLESGLSDCDAAEPMAETCNGLDDDCDDETDEPNLIEGEYIPLCDDENDCTDDSCLGETGCENLPLNEGECIDGDACTVGDHCEAGVCLGQPVQCDDGDPCTDDICDGVGGCATEFNTAPCDDDDPCTVADQCHEGICTGFPVDCECQVDEDCAELDDDDVCNGTLVCDTTKLPHLCVIAPDSLIECPEPEGPDAFCLQAHCDPGTGACSIIPSNEGFACDDGDNCTFGEACADGQCTSGLDLNCNDGNPCTDDTCEPELGCVNTNNNDPCTDGNACTMDDTCSDGACVGAQVLACDDENPCTDDACDSDVGCVHTANTGQCDDGNACTTNDICTDGACVGGPALTCTDDNPCTNDGCVPATGCVFAVNENPCDDGDLCTTGDHCHLGDCIGAGQLNCDDGNICTDDGCNPASGCTFEPNQDACDDGNDCTSGDHCQDGWCMPAQILNCNDDDPCTDDTCDPDSGCVFTDNSAPCDDGNECTTNDVCSAGACTGSGSLTCNDDDPCTDDTCDPDSGCVFTNNTAPCDDGDECTTNDACAGGSCVGGPELTCNDSNPCTSDSCDPDSGCEYTPVSNGTPCPGGTCEGGSCQAGGDHKIVFVSSQTHNGKFGGVIGADQFCQNLAQIAGLSGTFKAWLSSGTYGSSPASRFVRAAMPYQLVNGTVIADNWNDLTDGTIDNPINKDEYGNQTGSSMVYSFTMTDGSNGLFGSASSDCYGGDCHCNNWTNNQGQGSPTPGSAVAQTTKTNDDWTDYSFGNFCNGNFPIYCFQQ